MYFSNTKQRNVKALALTLWVGGAIEPTEVATRICPARFPRFYDVSFL